MSRSSVSLFILCITLISCKPQQGPLKDFVELKPPFKNQGQQEGYWAQELFKNHYNKTEFKHYQHPIKVIDNNVFVYGEKQFEVLTQNNDLKIVFSSGLLYPQLIYENSSPPEKTKTQTDTLTVSERYFYNLSRGEDLSITNIEELTFLDTSTTVKRFRFWLSSPYIANPTVYLFELTNGKAKDKTSLKDFIKGSKLTFLKSGWIIL